MDPIYDTIGKTYVSTRSADERIVSLIWNRIAQADTTRILDVGAGTANYSLALAERGAQVTALELSETMLDQARQRIAGRGKEHEEIELTLAQGDAQRLDFPVGAFDASVGVLMLHHLPQPDLCIAELARVTKPGGVIAFFTADPREREPSWIDEYFSELLEMTLEAYRPTADIVRMMMPFSVGQPEIERFPLPRDLADLFFVAAWARPELYLDEVFRAGVSHFAKAALDPVLGPRASEAVKRLQADMSNGEFSRRYGSKLTARGTHDAGYRLISFRCKGSASSSS